MPTITYKVLGQSKPAATALTDLYTVPAATSTVCSSIVVCNQDTVNHTYRISVAPSGAADSTEQYLAFDVTITANTFTTMTLGITLAATDKIRVYVDAQQVSFNLFGSEIS